MTELKTLSEKRILNNGPYGDLKLENLYPEKDVKEFINERLRAFADTLCCRNNTEEKIRKAIIKEIGITREKAGENLK